MACKIPRTKLGCQGLEVSKQGLGCMGMSAFYSPPKPEEDMISLIRHAVDCGVTFVDTSDIYGPFLNEILLGKALKGIRDKVQLATKFGVYIDENGQMRISGHPAYVRSACEASLKRLDVDYIDLYYQHRVDTTVPIEATVGEMKKLVEEGKVKYLGLSEASASTVRRAHAVHPITAMQLEWSLWRTRDVEEEIIPTCRELGIGVVVYSPLGSGFFCAGANFLESLEDTDFRKGCTSGKLALAWVQHQGDDVVPIPGTTKFNNFKENVGALQVKLSKEEVEEIAAFFHVAAVAGDRFADMSVGWCYANIETPPFFSWEAPQT